FTDAEAHFLSTYPTLIMNLLVLLIIGVLVYFGFAYFVSGKNLRNSWPWWVIILVASGLLLTIVRGVYLWLS
ncbi:MAG: hypothetical protein ACK41O_04095, partial [Runella zeae]